MRDYKVQFTEEKHLSIDWARAKEWGSISLERREAIQQAGDISSSLTAAVFRPVVVYESLGSSLSKQTSFLALISQVN